MINKTVSGVGFFLVGMGVGSAVGIILAPRSGDETRKAVRQAARAGTDYIQENARQVLKGAERAIRRGGDMLVEQKELIAEAVDVGREAYQREKIKAQSA